MTLFSILSTLAVSNCPLYLGNLLAGNPISWPVRFPFQENFFCLGVLLLSLLVYSSVQYSACLSGGFFEISNPMSIWSGIGNAKMEGVFRKDRNVMRRAS